MLASEAVWAFYIGGFAIAAVYIMVTLVGGHYLSITRGYVSLCSVITKKPYFHRPEMGGPLGFRTMFIIGVALGGVLAAFYNGGINYSFDLGTFENIWGDSLYTKAAILISGGFLWGYGSRMARGCTSGNAISGLAQGSPAALAATVCFLVGGVIVTRLIHLWV